MRSDEGAAGARHGTTADTIDRGSSDVTVEFCIDVRSETLRAALTHVGTTAGFTLRKTLAPGTCLVLDEPKAVVGSPHEQPTILVTEPTPCGAHAAMRALASGTVTAVISSDRPNDLAEALSSVRNGWAAAPIEIIEAAARMPDLTERQVAIVGAILAGQSTRDIAKGLFLSDASVKRELAAMFRSFGAENRLELAAFGASLGFRPQRITP
jgi:DNA-binding CsgD family transcriptional regulator